MRKTITCVASILIYTLAASINSAQAQESKGANVSSLIQASNSQFQFTNLLAQARPVGRTRFVLAPAINNTAASGPALVITPMASAPNQQVFGGGTGGRLTKWTGFTTNTSVIGDSNIYEDKFGKVGIGTTAPTSLFTVQGVIESFGGIKFGDGTTQTTSAAGALFGVAHDSTLLGNGTSASPLGIAVPLVFSGTTEILDPLLSVTNNGTSSIGVLGTAPDGRGVMGVSISGIGVRGFSLDGVGVFGDSNRGDGVHAFGGTSSVGEGGSGIVGSGGHGSLAVGGVGVVANGGDSPAFFGGDGIHAVAGAGVDALANGFAGRFIGNVLVTGNFSATGTKLFKIDHPLDPENKYLKHAAIESSEVLNIYSGNITTDQNGEATVDLPEWFEALNKDFRYQLTVIGVFAQAIVSEEIAGNRFVVKTSAPAVRVSWQVTGVRSDAVMKKYPFKAVEDKAGHERGYYLTPEVFNQPEEKSIEWARNPALMQKLKQQRIEAEEKVKKQQQQ